LAGEEMKIIWNKDITSCPFGEQVFLLLAKGEKSNGELAVGMLCPINSVIDRYWTWGGPNSGSDISEIPVAWAPLPEDWHEALDD
jgi:hypothetical protein